ncbi:peptide ABC transporter substrate-binding protein [Virgibacillus halophilus]|uniref:peptide ABC transporter substrate-binding protein n=1 Tax=Tigheibacillus halophilus TaxID=361280 RepID=UPI0036320C4A
MRSLKKWPLLLVLILAMAMFLAACGGKDKEAGGDKKDNGNSEQTDDGNAKPADDQSIKVNIKTEPPSLHPGLATDTTSGAVLNQTFEGLLRMNQDEEVEPAMAEKYDVSDDKKTYTFHLREDAKWSNGDPVTAADFEYAWKWILNPKNADADYAYQLYPIKGAEDAKENGASMDDVGIEAKDDHTLVVELENPTAYFLDLTTTYTYFPVNEKVAKDNDKWANDVSDDYVTNGPFLMKSWKHKDEIVLEKNPDYWDADTVKLENITMYMIDDENTAKQMFDNGELDWLGDPLDAVPLAAIPALKDSGDLNINDKAGVYYYAFNIEEKPFDNVNIRKAFALSLDRKAIVDNITKGEQKPAMALVPPSIFKDNEKGYFKDNDIDEAKKYLEKGLKEEGLKKLPTVKISYNTDEGHQAIAQAAQDMWKENLGVDVKLSNEEWAVYLDSMGAGDFQIGRMGWIGDFNDAINFLEIFQSKGGNNYTNWENDDYKKLLKQTRTEKDEKAREEILHKAEDLFMDELPLSPVYFYTNVWTQNEKLKNVEVSPLGNIQFKWGYLAE